MAENVASVSFEKTSKGKDGIVDANHFVYYKNRETYTSVYWLCSSTGCKSRVTTSVKGELISKLPTHDHGNNLLKRKAERIETDVINRFNVMRSVIYEKCNV